MCGISGDGLKCSGCDSGPRKNHEGVEEGSQQIIAIKDETSRLDMAVLV